MIRRRPIHLGRDPALTLTIDFVQVAPDSRIFCGNTLADRPGIQFKVHAGAQRIVVIGSFLNHEFEEVARRYRVDLPLGDAAAPEQTTQAKDTVRIGRQIRFEKLVCSVEVVVISPPEQTKRREK